MKFWKGPGRFLWSNSLREISKSTPVFFRLPLYVEYSISMTNCYDFYSGTLDAVMSIFSAHQLVTIFNIQICN